MPPQVYNVLFVCAGDPARGLMAQAILNRLAGDRFQAWCTTEENTAVHPLAVQILKSNHSWNGQRAMRYEQLSGTEAPQMDFVISVGERPPDAAWSRFANHPVRAQWRITDPAAFAGDPIKCKAAFRHAFSELENRLKLFVLVWGSPRSRRLAA